MNQKFKLMVPVIAMSVLNGHEMIEDMFPSYIRSECMGKWTVEDRSPVREKMYVYTTYVDDAHVFYHNNRTVLLKLKDKLKQEALAIFLNNEMVLI